MKVLMMSLGTRGDMEPFLAIGELLAGKGHEIVCAMPEQFGKEVEDSGFKFYPFDKRFMELLESEEAKNVLGQKGSILKQIMGVRKLYLEAKALQSLLMKEQWEVLEEEKPDRIIFHPKIQLAHLWGMENKGKSTLLFPLPHLVHPLKHAPTIPFSRSFGTILNLFSFKLVNFFTAKYLIKFTKDYHTRFNSIKIKNKTIRNYMLHEANSILMISRQFFAKPDYWGDNVQVLGYRERDKKKHWTASEELSEFIGKYPKIFFITFGSMTNPNPEKHTDTILSILKKHKIPAIINTFAGGLIQMENYPEHVLFVKRIPYDWVFEKCYAVMHHGGSGTLHMATKYHCPSLVIPHAMDQFFWKNKTAELGLGPLGIPIKKMTEKRLEPIVLDIWNNYQYKETAIKIGNKIKQEDYQKELIDILGLN